MNSYTVRVTKDTLVFSAGHFITFENGDCERLHGHNYRVAVEINGPLGPAGYVFDFIALRDTLQEIVLQLDHRMMIPTGNPHFDIAISDDSIRLQYKHKTYQFPSEDCVILPIANTTTELLAKYFCNRLTDLLQQRYSYQPDEITVEVEENFGQSARFTGGCGILY